MPNSVLTNNGQICLSNFSLQICLETDAKAENETFSAFYS